MVGDPKTKNAILNVAKSATNVANGIRINMKNVIELGGGMDKKKNPDGGKIAY